MTVQELMDVLSKVNPECEVLVWNLQDRRRQPINTAIDINYDEGESDVFLICDTDKW